MRVGWLADWSDLAGGAEFTQAEFRAAAPPDVEIVDCPPGGVNVTCDRYVIHNCVKYDLKDLEWLEGLPVVKYHHDVGPWLQPDVRGWLDQNATPICCSPLQAEYMGLEHAVCIPPPIDLALFEGVAAPVHG